jgi:hypothetical protein
LAGGATRPLLPLLFKNNLNRLSAIFFMLTYTPLTLIYAPFPDLLTPFKIKILPKMLTERQPESLVGKLASANPSFCFLNV